MKRKIIEKSRTLLNRFRDRNDVAGSIIVYILIRKEKDLTLLKL